MDVFVEHSFIAICFPFRDAFYNRYDQEDIIFDSCQAENMFWINMFHSGLILSKCFS